MALELRDIPPAPRSVARRTTAWRWWPLAMLGAPLTVFGGILTLLAWIVGHSSYYATAERALDARAALCDGVIDHVEPAQAWIAAPMDRLAFAFVDPDGVEVLAYSWFSAGALRAGQSVPIEFLPEEPRTARILGGHLVFSVELVTVTTGLTVVPGILMLLAWSIGVLGLRRTLRNGDAALAMPYAVRPIPAVVPAMLEVRFRFRDHRAQIRDGCHWVAAHSELGERLSATAPRPHPEFQRVLWSPGTPGGRPPEADWRRARSEPYPRLVVVHDRAQPVRCRLCCAADFVADRTAPPASTPRVGHS